MILFSVNRQRVNLDVDPSTPLLWVLRENLGLTGTKYGCGMAQCGACTVHLNGEAIRSCVAPVSRAEGKEVTTIEGLRRTSVIRCNARGWPKMYRSAAIANRDN